MNAIEKSKSNSLDRVIFGLGIRHVGKKAAKILSENFDDIYEIKNASFDKINSLPDFGDIMANSVIEFLAKDKTMEILKKLEKAGVNLKGSKKKLVSERLKNLTIVITAHLKTIQEMI
jgi:DNA ligase (NAD+)